jgi:hypothetical protein
MSTMRECLECGTVYSPNLLKDGRLPKGFTKCPRCNSTHTIPRDWRIFDNQIHLYNPDKLGDSWALTESSYSPWLLLITGDIFQSLRILVIFSLDYRILISELWNNFTFVRSGRTDRFFCFINSLGFSLFRLLILIIKLYPFIKS